MIVPWDDAGSCLRFSVTYEAADEAAEDALMVETERRLKSLNLVGFKVILSVTDGHRTNVKFYTELCGSLLRVSIPHPIEAGSRQFLLFDPVHLMKNFYNNFQRKR